jgi:two-component system, cell cycle sensor histidine kinase PleC
LSRANRELADTALRAEAASQAKSEFLANMSHEFRTPLNAIIGFSHIMSGQMFGPIGDQRYRDYASDISNSATHLNSVITAILDLSKAEAGIIVPEIGPVALPEIVELTVRLVEQRASEKGVAIRVDLDPMFEKRTVDTDRGKLTQILVNLLTNAVKFTEPGGAIRISAVPSETILRIAVADTGIGIAAADLDKVMTPFGQVGSAYRSHEGFGLGLPMARKLAEALGGSLILDSTPGEGTTVTVEVPLTVANFGERMTEAA